MPAAYVVGRNDTVKVFVKQLVHIKLDVEGSLRGRLEAKIGSRSDMDHHLWIDYCQCENETMIGLICQRRCRRQTKD